MGKKNRHFDFKIVSFNFGKHGKPGKLGEFENCENVREI